MASVSGLAFNQCFFQFDFFKACNSISCHRVERIFIYEPRAALLLKNLFFSYKCVPIVKYSNNRKIQQSKAENLVQYRH